MGLPLPDILPSTSSCRLLTASRPLVSPILQMWQLLSAELTCRVSLASFVCLHQVVFSSSGGCTSLSVYLPQDQSQVCFPLPEEREQAGKGFPIVFLAHGGDSRDPPLQGHGGWGLILSCPMWNQDAKCLKQPLV